MKVTFTIIFTLCLQTAASQEAAAAPAEIRVRVKRARQTLDVAGFGLRIAPPGALTAISLEEPKLTTARITRTKQGQWIVKWPGTEESARFDSPALTVRGQMMRLGIEPVPYDLEVIPNPKAGMDVVARLDLETYLAGVLPSEMPAAWPIEALKAQAVAARSFALRTAFERRNKTFDVDSTIMDQVYKFLHAAQDHPEWKEKIARAVGETRGQTLKDARGRTVKAFYSADCGCQTEDPKFVWGKVDNIQSVKDPTCDQRKTRQWEMTLSKIQVREKLVAAYELPEKTTLRTVQVAGKTPSGRVASVIATLDVEGKAKPFMMSSQEFRKIFSFEKIRSTDFTLKWSGAKMQILGSGVGHAVGLCQTGARALAQTGMKYDEILKLYYPKLKLWVPKNDKPSKRANRRQNNARPRFAEPV